MTNEVLRSADFDKLEGKLQSNAGFRGAFINDPVGALRREGIKLSDKQQRLLIQSMNQLRTTPGSMNNSDIGLVLTPRIGNNAFNPFDSTFNPFSKTFNPF